ncbi:hypothetical protein KKG58_02350, partial [Patescibacteria group bacterium]|nr:hypothetical protein [Patescibacteria group bacterium]
MKKNFEKIQEDSSEEQETTGDLNNFESVEKKQGIDIGKEEAALDLKKSTYDELEKKKKQIEDSIKILEQDPSPDKKKAKTIENFKKILEKINEAMDKKGEEVVEKTAEDAEKNIDKQVNELKEPKEVSESVQEEVAEISEQAETAGDKAKKKVGLWKKIKGVFTSKEVLKTAGKMLYDTATTLFGVKSLTDLLGVKLKRGDIYNYTEQSKTVKTEKEQLEIMTDKIADLWHQRRLSRTTEAVGENKYPSGSRKEIIEKGNKPLQEAIKEFKQKLEEAESISPQEKKEFKHILANIIAERSKKCEEVEKQTDKETKKTLDTYLKTKVNSLKLVKDGLNTALTFAGLSTLRLPMYSAMSILERAEKAGVGFDKTKLRREHIITTEEQEKEIKEASKMAHIAKDLTLVATTEFIRSITLQAKTEQRKKMGWKTRTIDFIQAFGQLVRILGLARISFTAGESAGESINKLVDSYEQGGVGGGIKQMGQNFVDNAQKVLFMKKEGGGQGQEQSQQQLEPDSEAVVVPVPVAPEQPISPEDLVAATVGKGEGPEHAFIRQLMKDPESFGYEGDANDPSAIEDWAGKTAHRIALDQGIVKTGEGGAIEEIRTKIADKVAYQFENAEGKITVKEIDLDTGEIGAPGAIDSYEYGYTAPPEPEIPETTEIPLVSKPVPTLETLTPEAPIEPIPLPAEVQDNVNNFNNLLEKGGKEKEIDKAIEALMDDYKENSSLAGDPEFKQAINGALKTRLDGLLDRGDRLFGRGSANESAENIIRDLGKINGLSIDETNAFLRNISGGDGFSIKDLVAFTRDGKFDQNRLNWAVEDFKELINSKTLPSSGAGWTPRVLNIIDEQGREKSLVGQIRLNIDNKIEVDYTGDGVAQDVYNPDAANNIMKSFTQQQAIMETAEAQARVAESTEKVEATLKSVGEGSTQEAIQKGLHKGGPITPEQGVTETVVPSSTEQP